MFWLQKSRNTWLKEGDRNTKFFHLSTIIRRRRNKLEGLTNDAGYFPQLEHSECTRLNGEVSDVEIHSSLFAIGGLKTPGPDGFPALFYQKYWDLCSKDILSL
ncbi:PREDICTED: Transposon TX1, partial [Prunus dulcis]